MTNHITQTQKDQILAQIAKEDLHLETLETRKSDSLDFHDCAVWCIKSALEAAYEAGQQSTTKGDK
ncbi:MAG: hypothetical protein GKR98_12850 [Boseongicola sp.]|nr:MAG: hypothetical protein GKR98_12850 [Boseongicola sp.]